MNLMDVFSETAGRQPDHPAILGPGPEDRMTYRELRESVEDMAERLKAAGIGAGSCVGLHYPSGVHYIVYNYALWRCGACVVPIGVELAPEEKTRICREIGLSALISGPAGIPLDEPMLAGEARALPPDARALPLHPARAHPAGFAEVNAAFLRFTSGTTGTSKGVVLSHETIFDRIHAANDVLAIGPEDRVVWLLSMAYHFAVSIVAYLSFGATILLPRDHFGGTLIRTVNERRGTLIYGSPMHYELMAHDRGGQMLEGLRLAISTTTALRDETVNAFHARFGLPLAQAFGIIEIGLPFINMDKPLEKRGSVGRLLPAYELQLEDVGLGDKLRAVKLRGKGFFDAYYQPWRTRREVMADGWFATGDLGWLDEEGYLTLSGRSKEVISVAGMKFFPQEVEEVLDAHPAVRESCIYAHGHDLFGEVPHARVVLREGAAPPVDELKAYLARRLAAYKIPERILFVDALTRTPSGKLIRDESRLPPA